MSDTADPWAAFRPVAPGQGADPWAAFFPSPAEPPPSIAQRFTRGLGLGARNVIQGAAGSLPGMAYDALMAALPRMPGTMAADGTEPQRTTAAQLARQGADALGLPVAETPEEKRNSAIIEPVAGAVASMGTGAPMVNAAAPATRALGGMLTTSPLTQAASSGVGGYVANETDSPTMGVAASLATPLALAMARRVVTPVPNVNSPGRQALVDGAGREGIDLTAGQATGSRFLQNVESQFEQLPFTSGPQRAIRENQGRQFITAAMRRAGETADDTMPGTINAARERIGGTIGEIANRNTLRVTPKLNGQLQAIERNLPKLPDGVAGPVGAYIKEFREMVGGTRPQPSDWQRPSGMFPGMIQPRAAGGVGNGPTLPGKSYRMLDSELGKAITATSNGDLKNALGQLRETLRTAMDASISPADAEAWQTARRQYANLMVIANAAGRAGGGAAEGMMSPVALRQALDASTGRGYVYGRGDLNELSRIGQALIKPPSDSGTAGRTYANNILTGSLVGGGAGSGAMVGGPVGAVAGAVGSLALPRLAQMAMNSQTGQAYLRNQVAADPTITQELARALLIQQLSGLLLQMRN